MSDKLSFTHRLGRFVSKVAFGFKTFILRIFRFLISKYILLIIYSVVVAITFYFVILSMIDLKTNTVSITNAGFAVIAAISSISFSWARTLEKEDETLMKIIVGYGEIALLSSILFLLASALKYSYFMIVEKNKDNFFFELSRQICQYGTIVLFTLAAISFVISTMGLLMVIIQRSNKKTLHVF